MTVTLVDPTLSPVSAGKRLAPRPASLDGAVLGLVNNGKARGREILQRVAANLAARHRISGTTILVTKPDSSFPAEPADIEMLAADATAIIAAIGD